MTRKFNIIVDGVAHEVEVEELGGSAAPVSAPLLYRDRQLLRHRKPLRKSRLLRRLLPQQAMLPLRCRELSSLLKSSLATA